MRVIRSICSAALLATGLAVAAPAAFAASLEELAAVAETKGPVIWYESSLPEDIAQIVAEFNKAYPNITVQHVRNLGGNTVAAKIIQELQAGSETASLATAGAENILVLMERDLVQEVDWEEIGVSDYVLTTPHAISLNSAVTVLVSNVNAVPDDEVPQNWDEILDPKWKGRIGQWVRATTFGAIAAEWGEEKTREYVAAFTAQEPVIYQSTFPLAQQVGSGEIDLGIAFNHTARPAVEAGSPVRVTFLDPTPVNPIWSSVVKGGGNPEGALVLAAWLASDEGSMTFENVTGGGNPTNPATNVAKGIGDSGLALWPLEEAEIFSRLTEEFSTTITRGQTPR